MSIRASTSRLRYSAKLLGLCAAVVLAAATSTTAAATSTTFDPELIEAVRRGDVSAVRSLIRRGSDVNAAQGDGLTPLHWAAMNGEAEIAEILVYAGANLAARTRNGAYTPLHVASRGGHTRVIETLLDAGADLALRTTNGSTPLHFAAVSGVPSATEMLLDRGAEVDAREYAAEQTPLIYAASSNYLAAVRVLLDWDADPNATTTVVDIAARAREDARERRQRNRRMRLLRELESPPDQQEAEEAAEEEEAEEDPAEEDPAEEEAAEEEAEEQAAEEDTTDEEAAEEDAAEEEQPADEDAAEDEAADEDAAEEDAADDDAAEEEAGTADQGPYNFSTMVSMKGAMTALLHAARQGPTELDAAMELTVNTAIAAEITDDPPLSATDRVAKHLANSEEPDGDLIIRLVREGEISLFERVLEHQTGLRRKLLQRLLYEPGGEGLAIVCRAIELSPEMFKEVLTLTRRARVGLDEKNTDECAFATMFYDQIEIDSAKFMLDRWRRNPDYLDLLRQLETLPEISARPVPKQRSVA